jgi:hypothetical protein
LIKLKSSIVGQVTEDRGMARANTCGALVKQGVMSRKDAAFICAQSFKQDPQQYWQNILRENPRLRSAYPEDWVEPQRSLPPQINSKPEQVM